MNRLRRAGQAVREALRRSPGWFVLAAGAVLCVLGWYGVSGETLPARQLPYLASATAPGVALLVGGLVMFAVRLPGRGDTDRLLALLTAEPAAGEEDGEGGGTGTEPEAGPPVALPDGTLYHRADCPLVAGKAGARPVDPAEVRERGLGGCPVCEPADPADNGGGA